MAAAVPRPIRLEYQSKGNVTGLTSIKADIYVNGVAKAVGSSAVVLTEVSSTNDPGLYELVITTAFQQANGAALGENTYSGYIKETALAGVYIPFKVQSSFANSDDIAATLGTPVGASLSADIAAVKTVIGSPVAASVSLDIAAVASQLSSQQTQLTALINAAQSGAPVAAALPSFETGTAANTLVIPFTLKNNGGALVNSTTPFTIGLKNAAGTDRGSYLTGSTGSPATVVANNPATGQYNVTLVIPANAPEEELILSTQYTVNGQLDLKYYISELVLDPATAGYALQSTLLSVQTTVNAINSAVTNATYGLSAIQTIIANGTYGLQAIQTYIASASTGLPAVLSLLGNATFGLQALGTAIGNAITAIAGVQADTTAIKGTGFVAGTDDLHSISAYVRLYLQPGNRIA